jgi:geranyl-CoA carboxylase alpha subunit
MVINNMAASKACLVANRGMAACRIIRTLKALGVRSIIAYTQEDSCTLATQQADVACLVSDYYNVEALVSMARHHDAALHPGYGFLSESPRLAHACDVANVRWIGPSVTTLTGVDSKQRAKTLATTLGIPTLPTILPDALDGTQPVMFKADSGGGGHGMRVVRTLSDYTQAQLALQRMQGGDGFLEPLIQQARHIEVQIAFDQNGHGMHLWTRDGSVQWHGQKRIERASLQNYPELQEAALCLGKHINYTNLGTVEFLVHPDGFFFLEINPRLQVEHGITEAITGIDLVAWQWHLAHHAHLSTLAKTICYTHTHAVQARVYAHVVKPVQCTHVVTPHHPVRVDLAIAPGDVLSPLYEHLVANVITTGNSLQQAQDACYQAVKNLDIGVPTHQTELCHWLKCLQRTPCVTTDWLMPIKPSPEHIIAQWLQTCYTTHPLLMDAWGALTLQERHASITPFLTQVKGLENGRFLMIIHGQCYILHHQQDGWYCNGHAWLGPPCAYLYDHQTPIYHEASAAVVAPFSGTIVALTAEIGDTVMQGDLLLKLHSMKWQHHVVSTIDGIVQECHVALGQLVMPQQKLYTLLSI